MKRLISVIVPVYNRSKTVVRCLESIFKQSSLPDELIVVDNNSTDDTPECLKTFLESKKRFIEERGIEVKLLSEGKQGAPAARNRGYKNSKGDFIIFFDSDDAMRGNLIQTVREVLNRFPEAEIVVWNCMLHLLDGREKVPPVMKGESREAHLIHTLLRPQGYAMSRELLESAGLWNESLIGWNDWELGIRLLLQNPRIVKEDKILADVYSQPESITGQNFISRRGVWEKSIAEGRRYIENKNPADKEWWLSVLRYRQAVLASHYHREGYRREAFELLNEAKAGARGMEKVILKMVFRYTSAGGRGAWRLTGPLLKILYGKK